MYLNIKQMIALAILIILSIVNNYVEIPPDVAQPVLDTILSVAGIGGLAGIAGQQIARKRSLRKYHESKTDTVSK